MKRECHGIQFTLASSARRGFSLIELLVVIGIMSLLVTVAMVNMKGFSKSGSITTGGNMLVDLTNQARQLAATKGANTALVVIKTCSTDDANDPTKPKVALRTVALMQYLVTGTSTTPTWQMASPWQVLPAQVSIINDASNSSFLTSPGTAALTATYAGKAYTSSGGSLVYQIFTPEGGMDMGTATGIKRLRLVPTDKQGQPDSSSVNFYDIVFNPYSGSTKVFRPGEEQ